MMMIEDLGSRSVQGSLIYFLRLGELAGLVGERARCSSTTAGVTQPIGNARHDLGARTAMSRACLNNARGQRAGFAALHGFDRERSHRNASACP